MRILMVASEASPFARSGGVADALGSLPRAISRLGHEVDVVIPRYRGVAAGEQIATIEVPVGPVVSTADVLATTSNGVRTIFIDKPEYYDRDYLYGAGGQDYADNAERFAFLARAALEWARAQPRYDVIHAHDWQAGLVPVLLRTAFGRDPELGTVPVVFTIHNLACQGIFDASWLPRLGLGWELLDVDALEFWGRISFLKAGVMFSRTITTVSPTYAREIQAPEYGSGFDGILRYRSADLVGIVNGIDYDRWDPARDPNLPVPYDASNLEGKREAKRAVLEAYGLPVSEETLKRPLIGMISRLVEKKGFDLLGELADELPRLGATIVLLGTGDRRYEDFWLGMAARHPDRIGARIGFDEAMVHLIEGGADLFLMPSRVEPAGLHQLYSLRYGTLPLVRRTGALADTVINLDPATGEGTGFSFVDYSAQALLGTLHWALSIYQERAQWRRMQQAGMRQDFSWDASAREYVRVYGEG